MPYWCIVLIVRLSVLHFGLKSKISDYSYLSINKADLFHNAIMGSPCLFWELASSLQIRRCGEKNGLELGVGLYDIDKVLN